MSNKLIIASIFMAWGSCAFAGPTISEISSLNAELKMQDLQNKLDDARNKKGGADASNLPPVPAVGAAGGPAVPAVSALAGASIESEDIKLVAIYGIGQDLKAEVLFNGNSFTVSKQNGNTKLGSWTVSDITPYRLVLSKTGARAKKGGKVKSTQREVFLSSSSSSAGDTKSLNLFASPSAGMPSGMNSPYVSPALPPVPSTPPAPIQLSGPRKN